MKQSTSDILICLLDKGASGINELKEYCSLGDKTIRFHISILKFCNFVTFTKRGNKKIYSLTSEGYRFAELVDEYDRAYAAIELQKENKVVC